MNPIGAVQRWAITTLVLLIVVGSFGGWMRHQGKKEGEQAGITSCSKKIAKLDARGADACSLAIGAMQTKYAEAQAKAESDARSKEQAAALAMVQIQQTYYQQGVTDANAKSDAVIAGLRVGALKLRHEWSCPAAASVPAPGASVASVDADADARAAGAADLVRLAAEYDARIRALQAVIRADRQ